MKMIENTEKRKNLFIQIILPLIIEENNRIKLNRKKIYSILNKNHNSNAEKKWLNEKFKQYGVLNKDLSTLKVRMDEVPVSLAIAQAAKETGWGTSRFALEGNALFGQWTWSKKGISPKKKDPDQNHKILQFQILKASVRAYKNNLNTHNAYKEFREARAKLRQNGDKINGLELTQYLQKYASIGKKYVDILENIITRNSLTDFDNAHLLPTKSKKGINL
jgi:Bax protein